MPGAMFDFSVVYDVHEIDEVDEDFANIVLAMQMLQVDYLGGHGTRGYGKVRFCELNAKHIGQKIDAAVIDMINEKLKGVSA